MIRRPNTSAFSPPIEPLQSLFRRVARRYRDVGRVTEGFVAGKLRRDPVHRAVLDLPEDFGEVVDLGCGRGQFAIMLLEAGRCHSALGLDCNRYHLAVAERAGGGLPFRTCVADFVRVPDIPPADTTLIVDVLYQLGSEAQVALLRAAGEAARRRVLVRTLDPERGLRSAVTLAAERLTRRLSPNAGACVNPLPVRVLAEVLEGAGFAVSVAPCWEGTPFSNVLVSALRLRP